MVQIGEAGKRKEVIYLLKTRDLIKELKKIEDRDQLITPIAVVDEARDEKSPLHQAFDWNDTEASEKWRLYQARKLINEVRIVISGKNQDAFHSVIVNIAKLPTKGYVSTEKILESEELLTQVKQEAIKEIRYWQKKYQDIQELSGIVNEEALASVQI